MAKLVETGPNVTLLFASALMLEEARSQAWVLKTYSQAPPSQEEALPLWTMGRHNSFSFPVSCFLLSLILAVEK